MKVGGIICPVVLLSLIWIAHAIDLANSGYPINRANPQRNNHINRPILCSSISNGRTTVLNREITFADETVFFPYWISPVLDEQDNLYIPASIYPTYQLRKIALSSLSIAQSATIDLGMTTVGKTELYASSPTTTAVFRRSDLVFLSSVANTGGDGFSSLVPYLSDLMIRAQIGQSYASPEQSYVFLNTSSGEFQNPPQAPVLGSPRDAIIYKTNTEEYPIFVGQYSDFTDTSYIMISAGEGRFSKNVSNIGLHTNDPFVVDSTLYVFTDQNTIRKFSVFDGTAVGAQSWNLFGDSNLVKNVMVKGAKVLASLEITDTEKLVIVELNNNVTVRSDEQFAGHPVFSLVDNVVLMSVLEENGNVKLLGLDWDTWGVKLVGNIGVLSNAVTSEPVIGENCNVHIVADGALHTFKPLPLQRVVPVIECIESDNTAYFSYTNLETKYFDIPFVADRNNLYPMDKAPVTSFGIGSGFHYPLGPSITLVTNPSNSYKWILEEYVLEFANTPALRCPTNIFLVIRFTASEAFDIPSFSNIVRNAFLNVTGLRDTRVSLGNITTTAKSVRAIHQSDESSLEVELQVQTGNQSEPSPSQVVTDFVTNQQNEFSNQVSNDPNAPAGVNVSLITTKQPETAQSGVLQQAPNSQNEPVASVPSAVPSASHRITLDAFALILCYFYVNIAY
jgi:hypothetical protein